MGEEKKGFWSRLVSGLSKTRDNIVSGIDSIFSGFSSIDDDFYEEHYESFGLGGHLVQTDFFVNNESEGGLQEQHVKKAKKILKEEA